MQHESRPQVLHLWLRQGSSTKAANLPKGSLTATQTGVCCIWAFKGFTTKARTEQQISSLARSGDKSLTAAFQVQHPTRGDDSNSWAESLYLCWWRSHKIAELFKLSENLGKEICSLSFGWDLQESIWRKRRKNSFCTTMVYICVMFL